MECNFLSIPSYIANIKLLCYIIFTIPTTLYNKANVILHDYNKVTLFNKFCYAIFTAINIATPTDTGRHCIAKYLN